MATHMIDDTQNTETPSAPIESEQVPFFWRLAIIAGILSGLAWALIMLFGPKGTNLLAGVAPVIGGIYVGRKIKGRAFTHGLLISLVATVAALIILLPAASQLTALTQSTLKEGTAQAAVPTTSQLVLQIGMLMLISLIPFPIYGTMIAHSSKKRQAALQEQIESRGGQFGRYGRVMNIEDMQALDLSKFGAWVRDLFKNNGFIISDYSFQKEVLDMYMERPEVKETWIVRCLLEDKVKSGTVQALAQELRDSETYQKGVIVTPFSVQQGAMKWAKTRNTIDVIDGETLWEMHSA